MIEVCPTPWKHWILMDTDKQKSAPFDFNKML